MKEEIRLRNRKSPLLLCWCVPGQTPWEVGQPPQDMSWENGVFELKKIGSSGPGLGVKQGPQRGPQDGSNWNTAGWEMSGLFLTNGLLVLR